LSPEAELLVVIPQNAGVTRALGESLSEGQHSEDTESETSDWETQGAHEEGEHKAIIFVCSDYDCFADLKDAIIKD